LPHGAGLGEAQLGDPVVGPLPLDAGQQALGPAGHVLRSRRLGRLGAHLVGLGHQRRRLLLGVEPLPTPAPLVGLALQEIGLPPDVVDVELGPVGVQVEDSVDDGVEHRHVVGDDDQPALVGLEVFPQPGDRVGVQVVGRLVEQQGLRAREQDPRQLDPAPLPTGEGPQRLPQHALGQPQRGGDRRGLGLRGIPTLGVELRVQPRVLAHRALLYAVIPRRHRGLGCAQVAQGDIQAAGGQDPVAGEDLQVTGAGVLREVADRAGAGHRTGRGQGLAGQHLGQRRLTRRHCARPTQSGRPRRSAGSSRRATVGRRRATAPRWRRSRHTSKGWGAPGTATNGWTDPFCQAWTALPTCQWRDGPARVLRS
jgi:hypothetical protein